MSLTGTNNGTTTFYTFQEHMLSCRAVATVNFAGTYATGPINTAVGATITALSSGTSTIDGVTLNTNDSVLLSRQSDPSQNGPYLVTVAGATSVTTVLTRRPDLQAQGQVRKGYYMPISEGAVYGGSIFVLTAPTPEAIGTDAINFITASMEVGTLAAFNVTCGQAALASGGSVVLVPAISTTAQYRVMSLFLNIGGTNFSGGSGDRLGQVTDGTTAYSIIPATNMQTLLNAGWGISTPLPFPASTVAINTATVAGANLVFKYSGGSADYTAGSLTMTGLVLRVA